ncbi:SixA phosphatase family protein [Pseudooceanicola algae]|uniref:Uncharacterized protein n=1 Tax=Pseudooceanicola algae TaxID=1537215 RepID=A0A418SKK2_9RHOB|nr:hypothetical protein PSAL_019990 [Pseudooceanicola algae]
MPRLILMRHAKSSWGDPTLDDHDRVLNPRGRRAAKALGLWLRDRGYLPDVALVSSAARTQETFDRLGLGPSVVHRCLPQLYHAGPARLMQGLRSGSGATLLLVAHNPGIAEFAERILTDAPAHPRFADYPTGATLVADFPAPDWASVDFGGAIPVDFIVPRDLTDESSAM